MLLVLFLVDDAVAALDLADRALTRVVADADTLVTGAADGALTAAVEGTTRGHLTVHSLLEVSLDLVGGQTLECGAGALGGDDRAGLLLERGNEVGELVLNVADCATLRRKATLGRDERRCKGGRKGDDGEERRELKRKGKERSGSAKAGKETCERSMPSSPAC